MMRTSDDELRRVGGGEGRLTSLRLTAIVLLILVASQIGSQAMTPIACLNG